jgi:hypothetical protein
MSVHIHTMRSYCAGALCLIPALAVIPLGGAYEPRWGEFELAAVTGRVTCGGRPLNGMATIHFLAADDHRFDAYGWLNPDGSFRLQTWSNLSGEGIVPGKYRVYFDTSCSAAVESLVDRKYQDPRTSDLLVQVGPPWNDFLFSLPEPGPEPFLAQMAMPQQMDKAREWFSRAESGVRRTQSRSSCVNRSRRSAVGRSGRVRGSGDLDPGSYAM